MFCTKCGSKLEEGARFCTTCATPVDEARKTDEAAAHTAGTSPDARPNAAPEKAAGKPAATEEATSGTLKAAVEATKHRSRRRVPLVVLIALALALVSGVAYAAFRVYTEIVLPRIEAAQLETASSAEDAPAPDAGGEPAQPQGNPRHVLQLGEILSMENPADIPGFLESQGLALREENPVTGATPDGGAFWGCAATDVTPFAALSEDGVVVDPQDYPRPYGPAATDEIAGGTSMLFGVDVMPPHGIGLFYDMADFTVTEADLLSGTMPNCVLANNLPLPLLDDEQASALAKACGLPDALASFSDNADEANGSVTARVGFLTVNDAEYCWYLGQMNVKSTPSPEGATPAYVRSFIGCCPSEQAKNAVADNGLYTDAEWEAADAEGRALMLAQSIVQGMHITNGGYRTNVITGETEFCYKEETPDETGAERYASVWMTEEELAAKEGPETAARIFGALGIPRAGN